MLRDFEGAAAVDADRDRRHTLHQPGRVAPLRRILRPDVRIRMGMRIDESRGDNLALRLDRARGVELGSRIRTDVRDRIASEDDVECPRLSLLSRIHKAAVNQYIRRAARVRGLGCAACEQCECNYWGTVDWLHHPACTGY